MLPKRKFIKKHRNTKKLNTAFEDTQIQSHKSLIQKLKSNHTNEKEEVLAILANLHLFPQEFNQPHNIKEIINLLYQGDNSIVYQTLFALTNLCEIQPTFTRNLFDNGFDKALIALNSTDKELLKPILIFFIAVVDNLPVKHQYLLKGIQNALTPSHLKDNTELCLQFLFRCQILPWNDSIISQPMIKQIAYILQSSYQFSDKSYAVAILSQSLLNQGKWTQEIQETLINFMTEMLVCIDLQKQYKMNFSSDNLQEQKTEKSPEIEEEEEQQMLEEGKKTSIGQKNLTAEERKKKEQKLNFFNNTIEGIQILLQFMLTVLQNSDNNSDQESDDEQQQLQQQNGMQKQVKGSGDNSSLKKIILKFIAQNMSIFPKFLCLSSSLVPSTENIVYLFYHLLAQIDRQLNISASNSQQNQKEINQLIQMSLQSLFSSVEGLKQQQTNFPIQEYEILIQCLEIGLKILQKNKGVGVREQFLIQFSKTFMISNQLFKSFKLMEDIKPSWIVMLELYSKKLNPEKNSSITVEQNYEVGSILKHLILSIPFTELQELRCQVIDTVFDVYSNQQFDMTFVQLGFFNLLEQVLKESNKISSKENKKKGKRQKFVTDVLKDLRRFLEYKHNMIKNV